MNWLYEQSLANRNRKFINQLTFGEVLEKVTVLAEKLLPYVEQEKRVALYSPNCEDMVLFFLALQELEIEVLMLNMRLTDRELADQLAKLEVKKVFAHISKTIRSEKDNALIWEFIPFAQVWEEKNNDGKAVNKGNKVSCSREKSLKDYNLEHIAVIMNTSATTGEFKSVPLRWKQLYAHAAASKKRLGATENDNWLMVLPMYHVSGLMILLRSLYNGTRVTIMEKFDEESVTKLITEGKINMLSMVPTMLNRIIHNIDRHQLRVLLLGGEFIPRSLVETCLKKKIPVYKTYGMTEGTSQITTVSILDYPHKIDSVGLPLEGVKITIAKPDEDGIGEIHIEGPMVMDGYLGQEKRNGKAFNTEDIGYFDKDGFLYILDRRKNIIISGGENIYPKEIENALYNHPQIKECAVVGMKSKRWGQVPALFVVTSLNEEEIIDYLKGKIAKYKLPKKIIYMDQLPKSGTGKVLTKELLKYLENDNSD